MNIDTKSTKRKVAWKLPTRLSLLEKFKFKNSILGKLFGYYIVLMILVLSISGVVNSLVSINESKTQFIASTKQILNIKMGSVDSIADTIGKYSAQIVSNKKIMDSLDVVPKDQEGKLTLVKDISEQLDSIMYSNKLLNSIYIINPDGFSVGSASYLPDEKSVTEVKKSAFYKDALLMDGKGIWSTFLNGEISYFSSDKVISNIRLLKNFYAHKLGILMINVSASAFNKLVENTQIGKNGYMYIIDEKGVILANPDVEKQGTDIGAQKEISQILQNKEGNFSYKDSKTGVKMFGVYSTSGTTGWKYVAVVPNKELTQSANKVLIFTIIISLICLVLTMFVSFTISTNIVNPLRKIMKAIKALENGNLTVKVDHTSKDEFGELSQDFNNMEKNLASLIGEVKTSVHNTEETAKSISHESDNLAAISMNIAKVMEEVAAGAEAQASKAQASVNVINSFSLEIGDLIKSSSEVNSATDEAEQTANAGMNSVRILKESSIESMNTISQVTKVINGLADNTKEISGILISISQISEQTNLLALNAAIEAARAGDAGRGFAVVADEVRKLAEDSKKSAQSISNIIGTFNIRTGESVKMAEVITSTLEEQVIQVYKTMGSFSSIKKSIDIVGEKIVNFNDKLDRLDNSKNIIINSIQEISDISSDAAAAIQTVGASLEEQAAGAEEVNSMANELYEASKNLKNLTDNFII